MAPAAERTWIPSEYLDEVCPAGRPTPTAWIVGKDGEAYRLAPIDDFNDESWRLTAKPGDIIGFHCTDDYGEAVIVVKPDGSYSVQGDVPKEATHFWVPGDPDTLASSLEDFVEQNRLELAEEYDTLFRMAWWSESVPHRIVVEADGPKFVQINPQ